MLIYGAGWFICTPPGVFICAISLAFWLKARQCWPGSSLPLRIVLRARPFGPAFGQVLFGGQLEIARSALSLTIPITALLVSSATHTQRNRLVPMSANDCSSNPILRRLGVLPNDSGHYTYKARVVLTFPPWPGGYNPRAPRGIF